jgi:hypothetical protein
MQKGALMTALAVVAAAGALMLGPAAAQSGRTAARPPPPATTSFVSPQAFTIPAGIEPLAYAVQPYAAFQVDVGDMRGRTLRNQAELDGALDKVATHNRYAVSRGLLAYGALTAAQSPAFVGAVRETAAFYGRESFIRGLMFDHGYARTMRGAPEAEQLILAALAADGDRVIRVGDDYKQLAYGVQRDRWGGQVAPRMAQRAQRLAALADGAPHRAPAPETAARLAPAAISASPQMDPNGFGGAWFWDMLRAPANTAVQTSMSIGPQVAAQAPQDRTLAINQMMTLAALYALDATTDPAVPVVELLNEQRTTNCFEMVQMQLRQCTSAARFHYETAFCLSEQGLQNVGRCIRDGRLNQ